MWIPLLLACSAPDLGPMPPPHPPPRTIEKSHPPAPPPPPPRPEPAPLPPVDPAVEAIFRDARNFMPDAFMRAMNATTAIGPEALPSLLRMATETENSNRLFALCEAVTRLDVRDDRVAWFLGPKLTSGDSLVESTCGQAVAHSLPLGSPDLPMVMDLVSAETARCTTRKNLAFELREPSVCSQMEAWLDATGCTQEVGIYGLGPCPGVERRMLEVAASPRFPHRVREMALFHLRDRDPLLEGRPTYLEWVDLGNPSNGMAYALELLADVGTREDLPLLQRVIQEDPHGGESVHAIAARKARRSIQSR